MKINCRFWHVAALVGAAIAVFGCGVKMEVEAPEEAGEAGTRVVLFRAAQQDTKAQFGPGEDGVYPTLWTANDTQVKLSLNYGGAVAAGVNPSEDYYSATFSAAFDFGGLSGPFTFYSVSPAAAAKALSPSREAWKVTIPCVQTPTAGSVDEAGIILAASSAPFESATQVSDVDLYFNHLTAYGRFSLNNLSLEDGETVSAVELTVTTPIVGDWYWHTSGSSITDYGASSTLTINTSRTSDIWFACAPVDVSGQMMYVRVFTSRGCYEQLVEFPSGRKFEAGQIAAFSVNMDGAEFTAAGSGSGSGGSGAFTLVTDASTLAAGDEVIITNTAGAKALGSDAGAYRNAVDISVSNNAISTPGDACILTLASGSSGTWAFKSGNTYLATSTTKNNLGNSTTIGDTSSWTVSISNGTATIIAENGGNYNYLQYNSSSPRFSGYAGTQQNVKIFRRSASSGSGSSADPLLSETEYGCYLGTGLERMLVAGEDQVTRAYSGQGVLTYTIINADDVEELEISGYSKVKVKGDQVEVSVAWRSGVATVLSQAYTMWVIKEEGPKVWLSDGNGKGVIIKK